MRSTIRDTQYSIRFTLNAIRFLSSVSCLLSSVFMRNKPNSPNVQTDVTSFIKMNYTIFTSLTKVKNKPNQTQLNLSSNVLVGEPKQIYPRMSQSGSQNKPNPNLGEGNFLKLHIIYRILYRSLGNICNQLVYQKCVVGGNNEFRKMSFKVQL